LSAAARALCRRSAWRALAGLLLAGLAGCSADAVEEPAPTLENAGTFVATPEAPDHYRLLRVRNTLVSGPELVYLFLDEHLPGARSLDEALALARDPELLLLPVDVVLLRDFVTRPHVVLWHRSLHDDERF